jgi:hypothetical protein
MPTCLLQILGAVTRYHIRCFLARSRTDEQAFTLHIIPTRLPDCQTDWQTAVDPLQKLTRPSHAHASPCTGLPIGSSRLGLFCLACDTYVTEESPFHPSATTTDRQDSLCEQNNTASCRCSISLSLQFSQAQIMLRIDIYTVAYYVSKIMGCFYLQLHIIGGR